MPSVQTFKQLSGCSICSKNMFIPSDHMIWQEFKHIWRLCWNIVHMLPSAEKLWNCLLDAAVTKQNNLNLAYWYSNSALATSWPPLIEIYLKHIRFPHLLTLAPNQVQTIHDLSNSSVLHIFMWLDLRVCQSLTHYPPHTHTHAQVHKIVFIHTLYMHVCICMLLIL